jgi:septum formation protein
VSALQAAAPRLVLASGSASRRALLAEAGLAFEARPAEVDEAALKVAARGAGHSAGEAALLLASAKAERVAADDPEALVLGCDQLLLCEGRWFDKPANLAEAAEHLRALSGRTHVLETATVALLGGREVWSYLERPSLTMRPLSEAFIAAYLAREGERVLGSVGAYRLEGPGVQLFQAVEGEHSAILGLPLLPLMDFLRKAGVLLA